jgi:hypothetical protein
VVAEGSSHYISTGKPEVIVVATREIVDAVRDPSTWATPVASSAT